MTVKIGMGGSALDLKDAHVWGNPANKIMAGTGTSAVEVWSATPSSIEYPQSGSWGPIDASSLIEVASHTLAFDGTYTVTLNSDPNVALQITVNSGAVGSAAGTFSFTTYLPAGMVIGFQALAAGTASGTWSISLAAVMVTPTAPTFLADSPWVVLPSKEGVDYTIVGTPGDGQHVTVIATAQQGYELAGVTSWEHTWASTLPVVQITGTSGNASRDQFRAACVEYGTTYQTVTELPFMLDTSQASDMYRMFYGCSALTHVPDLDTANVTNMTDMFYGCSALTQGPDLDTANVTNMYRMFYGCSALTHVPDMDTSNVTDMGSIFYGCSLLTHVPDLDTSQVTDMSRMFYDCSSLTTAPALDVSQTTTTAQMFRSCVALTSVPDLDTSSVTTATQMFQNCSALTDGNVRLIGKHPSVSTTNMISGSGLTREPFFNAAGQPI